MIKRQAAVLYSCVSTADVLQFVSRKCEAYLCWCMCIMKVLETLLCLFNVVGREKGGYITT